MSGKPIVMNVIAGRVCGAMSRSFWAAPLLVGGLLFFGPLAHASQGGAESVATGPTQADIMLLVAFVLLALVFSFLCSVAEAVLLSITPSFVEKLRATSPKQAERLKALRQDNVDRSLAAILTVNTIAHTVGAIAAGAQATIVFGSAWIGVFSGAMTLAILFLSEIIPKTIGAIYWPNLVAPTMVFIQVSIKLLYPLIWISEGLTKLIARGKSVHLFGRDELLAMTNIGERSGEIDAHEARIIRSLIQFRSVQASDIMTPRTVVTALKQDISASDALAQTADGTFSRLPVYGDGMDDITGVVLRDEILALEAQNKGGERLASIKREIKSVPEGMTLPNLLEYFLDSQRHMALVVDEFGGTKGIVTLEDVIESLLGMEIMDEKDNVEDMRHLARRQWHSRAEQLGIDVDQMEQGPVEQNEEK